MDFSVHRILKARILKWVAISFSRKYECTNLKYRLQGIVSYSHVTLIFLHFPSVEMTISILAWEGRSNPRETSFSEYPDKWRQNQHSISQAHSCEGNLLFSLTLTCVYHFTSGMHFHLHECTILMYLGYLGGWRSWELDTGIGYLDSRTEKWEIYRIFFAKDFYRQVSLPFQRWLEKFHPLVNLFCSPHASPTA